MSDGTLPTAAQLEALTHFGYAPLRGMPIPDLDPIALVRRWRLRHQQLWDQVASAVIHERAISTQTKGGLSYWPCTFCSVRSRETKIE